MYKLDGMLGLGGRYKMHHSIGTRPRSDWSIGLAQAKFVLAGLGVGHVSTVGFHKHFKYQDSILYPEKKIIIRKQKSIP